MSAATSPVFVTKDDARDAQRAEAGVYGGQNPRGGEAAQMQVSKRSIAMGSKNNMRFYFR